MGAHEKRLIAWERTCACKRTDKSVDEAVHMVSYIVMMVTICIGNLT
jgi:hypothetical protein